MTIKTSIEHLIFYEYLMFSKHTHSWLKFISKRQREKVKNMDTQYVLHIQVKIDNNF